MQRTYLKRCYIPSCKNNSSNCKKRFFKAPEEPEMRKAWYNVIGESHASSNSTYCCEDHFNFEFDAENWAHCVLLKDPLILRPTAAPRKYISTMRLEPKPVQSNTSFVQYRNIARKYLLKRYIDEDQMSLPTLEADVTADQTAASIYSFFSDNSPKPRITYAQTLLFLEDVDDTVIKDDGDKLGTLSVYDRRFHEIDYEMHPLRKTRSEPTVTEKMRARLDKRFIREYIKQKKRLSDMFSKMRL